MGIFGRVDITARLHDGADDLEVVGESNYQDALWSLCGGSPGDRIRCETVAVLVPEPDNPHDANAIAVRIDGRVVGYLPARIAAAYVPGLRELMARTGAHMALRGVITGGGHHANGPGGLGVWLRHDPTDLGGTPEPPRVSFAAEGTMRTGFSQAWQTDLADDSYDLSWYTALPPEDRPAIAMLRDLLAEERDVLDRHFQFAELEARLYRARDRYDTALTEFDDACRRHDAEMDVIRAAAVAKWGKVPLLDTYRQMAIRQQKLKDWPACLWWCERGLALYGTRAAREDAVEDLVRRRDRALAKVG
jgi:HIRAN domain-containing protein